MDVLRCRLCNKPFNAQSTLKRHIYYCRSKKNNAVGRRRSCVSCVKAKARCNNKQPSCSRCVNKLTECRYPVESRNIIDTSASTKEQSSLNWLDLDHSGHKHDLIFDTALDVSGSDFGNLGGSYLDSDLPSISFLNQTIDYESAISSSLDLSFVSSDVVSSTYSTNIATHPRDVWDISIPTMPSSTVRSFNQRKHSKTNQQRTSNLIFHTLKSYSLMMLRDNCLPPFIHPHWLTSDVENNDMESLINCINLIQMRSRRLNPSRKLFWKNVQMECDRLLSEYLQLNQLSLLGAMQGLSIYILLRLEEGETDHNNLDALLIATVTAIATQFNRISGDNSQDTQKDSDNKTLEMSWKTWIFEESARRLCLIYQVVNMLIYFEPALMCTLNHVDLLLSPLPAKKQLWEAKDERS